MTGRYVARDKRLGAQPGITAVLHTWTRKLELHPHLHCIVTGGGLDGDGRWKPAADNHLFPVKVLAKLFRGKLMAALAGEQKAGEGLSKNRFGDGRRLSFSECPERDRAERGSSRRARTS